MVDTFLLFLYGVIGPLLPPVFLTNVIIGADGSRHMLYEHQTVLLKDPFLIATLVRTKGRPQLTTPVRRPGSLPFDIFANL